MVVMGPLADGSISSFVYNISNYLCTNFGAFIKNYTVNQLIRSTTYTSLYLYLYCIVYTEKFPLWYYYLKLLKLLQRRHKLNVSLAVTVLITYLIVLEFRNFIFAISCT